MRALILKKNINIKIIKKCGSWVFLINIKIERGGGGPRAWDSFIGVVIKIHI